MRIARATGVSRYPGDSRGQSLVEFSVCVLVLLMLLLGVVEICRIALVYTSLSTGVRIGVRYAAVHGSNNPASTAQVESAVKNALTAVNSSNVTVTVTYPDASGGASSGCTAPGCHVSVTASYPYDPFISYFPISLTLGSTSQGVITF